MQSASEPRAVWVTSQAVSLGCVAAFGIAALALMGWQLDLAFLRSLVPGSVAMNPLTAVCLMLLSASLWVLRAPQTTTRARRVARACAMTVVAVGGLKLLSVLSGIDMPLDQVLFHGRLQEMPVPKRMAPNTALVLVLLGLGHLTLDVRAWRGWPPAQILQVTSLAMAVMALIGYLYGAPAMYGVGSFIPMAANTALAFSLLSVAAVFSRPDRGLFRLLLSDSPGGALTRRLLPAAIAIPIGLEWLQLAGQRAGLYGLEIGAALMALVAIAPLVALIWLTARDLDATDRERRRAEEALKSSLVQVKCLVDSNIVGVVTGDNRGWIHEANDAYLEMTGRTRADLPFRWDATRPAEARERDAATLSELAERGLVRPHENVVVRKDGARVPVLVGLAALPGDEGKYVAFVLDLSSRKRAEAELDRTRAFVDSIVENLPDMVFVKDARDLRFVRLNRAAEELLDCPREDLLGKNDYDLFPTEQADFFTAKDRAVLDSGALLDIPEEPISTRTKGLRLLHTKKVPIADERGEPLYLLGISEDITDVRQAEAKIKALHEAVRSHADQLEVANKELEAFSYSVSHDLRAPLRHVDGFADLLRRHAGSTLDEKASRYLDLISDSAKSMGALIDDLLIFSRMGRAEMQRTTVDLAELVARVQESLAPDTSGRAIEWRIARLPRVNGDPAMLKLVLTNLIGNAIKYTKTRPTARIEIGIEPSGTETTVFVRDNGVGFDMEYGHKLFGVFQRLHHQDEFEGTGIGLANVRRIIQRHGGRTWAEGRLGEGATFYFSLPGSGDEVATTREAA